MVPFGRSRREYELMFALGDIDLSGRVFGCADGPASFNAELSAVGRRVTSVDPLYELDGLTIRDHFYDYLDGIIEQTPDDLAWAFHGSPEGLRRNHVLVLDKFTADFDRSRRDGRYVIGSLPSLPFADGDFDLCRCSHFLFLYSAQLGRAFHERAIVELCREVRVDYELQRGADHMLRVVRMSSGRRT